MSSALKLVSATTSLKDWAARIAADAPPLSEDQFRQLQAIFVGGAQREKDLTTAGHRRDVFRDAA